MCNKGVACNPWWLRDVPDHLKTQEMCIKAVEEDPHMLRDVPDQYKTQEMCEKAVKKIHGCWKLSLIILKYKRCAQYDPNWFVTQQQQVKLWHDDGIRWYEGYQKRNDQKAQIKKELICIA